MPTLRNVNLNLLPVLHALVHHRSVTRAGEALNMSQSAVSDALAHLRHVFDDPLLIKSGRQMLLTDLAKTLIPQVDEAVGSIQALFDTPDLDPGTLSRQFVIGTADSVMMTVGPVLVESLTSLAPAVSVQFVSLGAESLRQMKAGEIDLMIGPAEVLTQMLEYRSRALYQDEFVCIMRSRHPLARRKLTARAYWSATHASYQPDNLMEGTLENQLMRREGASTVTVAKVPQFSLLPFIVEKTDCLAMVSRRVAELMRKQADIVIRELPFQPTPIPMSMFWNDIKHNDPAHRWFRELLEALPIS